jgi:hypothetical protein
MFFNSKKEKEPVEEIATETWSCMEESCLGWARKNFTFHEEPECPLCEGQMVAETRMLPALLDKIPYRM